MKLNIEKFMKTEMGYELKETICAWDMAITEKRKVTPGIGNPDHGLGFNYWNDTYRSCQDRWEVFKLAIKQCQSFLGGLRPEYEGFISPDLRFE